MFFYGLNMDTFFTSIPTTPLGWIMLITVIIVAILYLTSRIRANDMQVLRDNNKDQGDRITLLEAAVTRLEGQIIDLQHQNKTLNDLVVVALKQYFFENPTVAGEMQKKIMK